MIALTFLSCNGKAKAFLGEIQRKWCQRIAAPCRADYASGMKGLLPLVVLLAVAFPALAQEEDFDPAAVDVADAVNCHLDAPTYNGFAIAIGGEGGEAARRQWRRVDTGNPFLEEYELPEPVVVTGDYATRRIAFTSNGVLAILDLADPARIAQGEGIANAADAEPLIAELVAAGKATRAEVEADMPFRKFLGQRILAEATELPGDEDGFGTHTIIARNISNVTTHPGKTFYGCSYKVELIDKDGKPL